LYAKIIHHKLRTTVEALIQEEKCGFRMGRSSADSVFTIKQVTEKERV
jgi:hypothetical protein